ncbi:MAG TPA: hypothetical protein IAB51_11630 [Candidatus Merdivicinus excrementipullorum]|uniref:V-type ATP synthase subunit E n=1 Tax=Candidatus Merdivicinus excrementipullorum TaxID=2840867 RepID=A0A9D1K1U1_9FIRM|nr:hypothetical protein [Candidatus Merdivicinus excrementipullorum]
MPNETEKLARFEKAVSSEVETKTTEILAEVDSYKEEKLVDVKEVEIQRAYDTIQRKAAEIRASFARDVTKEKVAARQRLLRRRSELTEELFCKAAEKVKEFTKNQAYREKLKSMLEGRQEGWSVLVRAEDEELVRSLAGDGVTVRVSPEIKLGGIVFYSESAGLYQDETYDAMLKNAQEEFYNSGRADLSKLEGVGDFA